MSLTTIQSQQLTSIRDHCLLGLPSEQVIQQVAPRVRTALGANFVNYSWLDDAGQICNHYLIDPSFAPTARLYFDRFYNRAERTAVPTHRHTLTLGAVVTNSVSFESTLLHSELFADLLRPARLRHTMRTVVRDSLRIHGTMTVGRDFDAPPFAGADEQFMTQVAHWLAHAVVTAGPVVTEPSQVGDGEEGLIIADSHGRLAHLCPVARRLAFLISNPRIAPGADWQEDGVTPLAQRLVALLQRDAGSPPLLELANGWGRFSLRAFHLLPAMAGGTGMVGIAIRRRQPELLRLLEGVAGLPLSQRERQVAPLWASGARREEIAARLGVSSHTVVTYVRSLYAKSGARDAATLRALLLRRAAEGVARM